MSKIFKPRRGISSVMQGSKAATVLSKGEFFMECPDTGVGTGKSKIKMGDGVTPYIDLPYAVAGMDSTDPVDLDNKTYSNQAAALNDVTSGKSLKTVLNALKAAIKMNSDSVSALSTDTAAKLPFKLGISNGVYGYYQLNNTFKSFRQPTGNAGAAQVLQSSGANGTGTIYTASNASSDGFQGGMVNRGALNWSGSNTTANVAAGYYSGGTLDSRPSYNAGYSAGKQTTTNLITRIKQLTKIPLQRQEACPGRRQKPTGYYDYDTTGDHFWVGSCPVCGGRETHNYDWWDDGMGQHNRTVTYDYAYSVTETILNQYA